MLFYGRLTMRPTPDVELHLGKCTAFPRGVRGATLGAKYFIKIVETRSGRSSLAGLRGAIGPPRRLP